MSSFKELKERIKQLEKENERLSLEHPMLTHNLEMREQQIVQLKNELHDMKHNSASHAWIIASCVLCATNVAMLILFIIYALNN